MRVPSRIRRIDFVDEPSRSSVIIDLEEPSGFTVERSANRRVSLRLDHADLPDELVRSLDATEYLGPVRLLRADISGLMSNVFTSYHISYHIRNTFGMVGNALKVFRYVHYQQSPVDAFGIFHHKS